MGTAEATEKWMMSRAANASTVGTSRRAHACRKDSTRKPVPGMAVRVSMMLDHFRRYIEIRYGFAENPGFLCFAPKRRVIRIFSRKRPRHSVRVRPAAQPHVTGHNIANCESCHKLIGRYCLSKALI